MAVAPADDPVRASERTCVKATVASAIPTAPAAATTGVPKTRRIPPNPGPTRTPRPSPALEVTFAATSSSGDLARLGMIAFWIGRIAANATALAAAITRIASRPASSARPTAVAAAVARAAT